METIEISVKDFLKKVAEPMGMSLSGIELQLRDELRCGESLKMIVGKGKTYVMSLAEIKAYFNIKDAPPEEEAAQVDKKAFDKMMDFDAGAETIAAKPDHRPAEGKKGGK